MRFCVPFPMFPADHVRALASVAEEAGFHFIAVPDSVFYPETVSAGYPYSSDGSRFWAADTPFVDPTVSMAWMAARTSRIRFVTNVLKTPLRDPLLLAKQIASLAVMADDRIEIGVGLSWIPEEFAWTGTNMRTRGARLDEQIDILRLVCSGNGPEFIEHHGKHYDFGRLMISPSPSVPVKIHVGGHSEPALERAARVGDGWISVQATTQEITDIAQRLSVLRSDHGRSGPFSAFVLPIDAVGPDAYRRLGDTIESFGMEPVFMAVPWYYSGKDPNDLDVRRESLLTFGESVIAKI